MPEIKTISGTTSDDIWLQVAEDICNQDIYEYHVLLQQNALKVELIINIDLGGGFEGGYSSTTFRACIAAEHDFRFSLHHHNFIDTVGVFFGMEDVVIGYPEFDEELIVKTNNSQRMRQLFSDENTRKIFQSLRLFTFHIIQHQESELKDKEAFLELTIEDGITDLEELRSLYYAFYKVLTALQAERN